MVRKLGLLFVATFLLLAFAFPAFADSYKSYQGYPVVKVVVNGQEVKGDVPAIIINERTLVPVRAISETLGLEIHWDDSTNTVYILSPGTREPLLAPGQNVIRIGLIAPLNGAVMGPLNGTVRDLGESITNGFSRAVEEGCHLGDYKIEAVIADDCNDPGIASVMAARLITGDRVSAIVGSLTSKCTIPITDFAQYYKVPVITPTGTNPDVTFSKGQRKDYAFRASFIDPLHGTMAARFALEKLRLKTAVVLYDQGNSYTEGLARKFKEAFEKGGGRVLLYEAYSRMDVDYTPVLTEIARQKPDIFYLPDFYMKANLIGKQARERGIEAIFLGGDAWDSPDIDFQTMEGSYFTTHWSPEDPRPEVRDWVSKYKVKYGATPDMMATLAYDATRIVIRAIETTHSGDPAKIKEAMQNLKDFPAITGKINFGQDGNPIKPVAVMQIKGGRQVYVTIVMP
ncbi:MAG: ABC transporter substrate-binding protein [Firmicutes bacterium]|nr:ABC transporter substrate-binding protein [Bacillota bacterium]